MGRKKKIQGKLLGKSTRGKPVRLTRDLVKALPYIFKGTRNIPHGKASIVWELTTFLKERAPLVYVFIVDQLRKPVCDRDANLQKIVEEWRVNENANIPRTPTSRELTAYIVERAMGDAWEVWGLKRPYSDGMNHDNFFRRYVHGRPGNIKVFRDALHQPQPWSDHHVGHEVNWFLGRRGQAARHYNFLKKSTGYIPVIKIQEEE